MLAGAAIALTAFAGTPTASVRGHPGGTAASVGAARPPGADRAIGTDNPGTPRTVALVAYGQENKHPRPSQHSRQAHPKQHGPKQHRPKHHKARRHRARRHRARQRSPRRYRTPGQIAYSLLPGFDWASWQFRYLNLLWMRESGWNRFAYNPYSGAYGIPQAVPGNKMASAGPNWRTSARTQIIWGMGYIKGRYVTPWGAWQHELQYGWY
ncbi:MAG TPA: hypothetical protein VMV92_05020 [Streptosporangiaceae bacterium]|nr:hypothetical protein [Streptosporangiaceae bacterium]